MILCIETATDVCSVALCSDDKVISLREKKDGKSHSSLLTVFISEILKEQQISIENLKAVAVSKGPGSFTGLRIGVSVAKGIAYGSDIPLIAIDTLTSMYFGILPVAKENNLLNKNNIFCPMIDARRMEVFYCLFDTSGRRIKNITAEIINENTFEEILPEITLIFFGDGAEKCSDVIKRKNRLFISNFSLSASFMHIPAVNALKEGRFENKIYFEPFYLKDFLATKPKRKVI